MRASSLTVRTAADGTVVVRLPGVVGVDMAVDLRQLLVRIVRRDAPLRLVVSLGAVSDLDAINLGTLAALCTLGDDHRVIVFLDGASAIIAAQLKAAGVPAQRLRRVRGEHSAPAAAARKA
jgi:anti-anti-sigma regulatory factor